ncbi:MAG: hypothetical protein IPP33_18975 [Flavobacteriales bacterium]|nr:hypothetical protein [Flavobacteriales bacterium]
MFGIIGLFLLVSYALFSLFRNAEQNAGLGGHGEGDHTSWARRSVR